MEMEWDAPPPSTQQQQKEKRGVQNQMRYFQRISSLCCKSIINSHSPFTPNHPPFPHTIIHHPSLHSFPCFPLPRAIGPGRSGAFLGQNAPSAILPASGNLPGRGCSPSSQQDDGWQALVGMAPWPQPGCDNLAKTKDMMAGDGMNVVGGKTGGLAPSARQDGEWRELVKLAIRNEILVVRFHPFPALGFIRT